MAEVASVARVVEEAAADTPSALPRVHGRGRGARALASAGRTASRWGPVVAFLAAWEVAPRIGLVDPTFLVPFSTAVRALGELTANGQLPADAATSLELAAAGFFLALAVAVPLGLLIGWYKPVARSLNTLLELFRNTAALALLPVFTLILGIGQSSKIAIVAYACAFPALLNTISAVRSVDPTLIKAARSLGLSAPRLFRLVVLPASAPQIITGARMSASASIVVLIAAEMVGAKSGLGYLINMSQQNFALPQMYAGIIAISLIGVSVNQALVLLERRLTRWRG